MLFKPEHEQMILEGKKTVTRRVWKRPMVKVGGIYKAKLKMLDKKYFAKIKVLKLYKQKLKEIMVRDIEKEGYSSLSEFVDIWKKINKSWEGDTEVYVIEFEVVKK